VAVTRLRIVEGLVPYVGRVLVLLACAPALWAVSRIAHELAGKNTSLNITVVLSVSFVISLGGVAGVVAMWRKQRGQRERLQAARERQERLEKEVEKTQQELSKTRADLAKESKRADDLQKKQQRR
jgi:uncharacterized protein HemX